MRVYDIALMLVRALVAMDLIHSGLSIAYTAIRYGFLIGTATSEYSQRYELSTWFSPAFGFVSALIVYACSKPIARFAAKLAAATDTATHF